MKYTFRYFDRDEDGEISLTEFLDALRDFSLPSSGIHAPSLIPVTTSMYPDDEEQEKVDAAYRKFMKKVLDEKIQSLE